MSGHSNRISQKQKCCKQNYEKKGINFDVSSGVRGGIPLQPVVKTVVKQVIPLKPMEDCVGAHTHAAACGGPHTRAGGCVLKEAAICGDPTSEQAPSSSCSL